MDQFGETLPESCKLETSTVMQLVFGYENVTMTVPLCALPDLVWDTGCPE
jgi:hypothetical protein